MRAAGILGQKRSKYQRPILHNSKSPETPRKLFLEIIKNIEQKKYQRGPRPWPSGWGRAPCLVGPCWPSDAHLLLYEVFRPKKNQKQAFRTRLRRHEAEPWRNQSRALAELFCRGHFPPGGGNHRHRHHQHSSHRERAISIIIFTSTISSQNPSSSLVSNSCLQVRDWYQQVASSVNYSLQLMLVGLFGGRSYVQILYAY